MPDSLLIDSILDKSAAFLCVLDSTGKIVTMNTRLARLIGNKSRESLIGMPISDAIEDAVELKTFFTTVVSATSDSSTAERIIQPVHKTAEKPLWIQFDISRMHSANYGLCTFLSGSDISEEIIARRDAEQKAHERSSFLVRMGHELRTPLNTVLGYAQLLHGLEGLSPVAKEYAATILSNENTLMHLLSDVLEFSKYEAGQTTPIMAVTDIKKLIHEVTESYINQFNSKYLSLTVEYKTDIPEAVLTDAQKVSHVLSNILGNALKFTRKGGVTISVSCDKLITIDVEDTGIGIDAEDHAQIFDVFAQSGTSKEHMTGTGIGLAVARIFARMLGGDVVLLASDLGKGSLFRFTFAARPVHNEKKNAVEISDYSAIKGISKPCKVLLVDDVDINLAMLEIFLAPAGFEVGIAANGNEAVDKFKSFKPNIVFMDLIMPEKDGFEATREIKAIDSAVPVIALTASIVDNIKEQALAAGVNDFMYKPFIPERFFEIIAEHTGLSYTM
ncbi:MAG TPA: response regulator [Treponemataceae bacterium]|nr:response regulator [Treponemataceae bacterium]